MLMALYEIKMVPTIALNPYCLPNSCLQFNHSIKRHKKSGLEFGVELELRVKFSVIS